MSVINTAIVQYITVWDTINNVGLTGQAANITLRAIGDGTLFTPSAPTITEVDSTNLKGVYKVSLIAAENNYASMFLGGICSASGAIIQGVRWTNDQNFSNYKMTLLNYQFPNAPVYQLSHD